jgi:hypothetical protein
MLKVLCIYAALDDGGKVRLPSSLTERIAHALPNRSAASVQMRLANYISRDKEMAQREIKGLFGGGDHVDQIWEEFTDDSGQLVLTKLMIELALLTPAK